MRADAGRRGRRLTAAALGLAAVLVPALGVVEPGVATTASEAPTAATLPPPLGPPFNVLPDSLRLDDPTRPTPARGSVPATSGRVLETELFVPSGAPGPLPLVVFAHGWNSDPGQYVVLLRQWAAAGFLVAAPVFPDSTDLAQGSPVSDYSEQAQDISFVITWLLDNRVVTADGPLQVDSSRIAVAGHSDGGTDVALMAMDAAYADARVKAYVCLSGEMPTGVETFTPAQSGAAFLAAVGSNDEYGLLPRTTAVFDEAATSSKALVVEEGGDHLGSFLDATTDAAAMREETTRFMELALEPQAPSTADVLSALQPVGSPALTIVPPS
jgi:poly(3-hydroxybutyrate) depolymerase